MIWPGRAEVVWLGRTPEPALAAELAARNGLRLVRLRESRIRRRIRTIRAVVIEFDGDSALFFARARRVAELVAPHGGFIAFVHSSTASPVDFQRSVGRVQQLWRLLGRSVNSESFGAEAFYTDYSRLAQRLCDWNPGPPEGVRTSVTGRLFDDSDRLLLRRAFQDFARVSVKKLSGGKSGAKVYQVVPRESYVSGDPCGAPFLAKIDVPNRVAEELAKYGHWVRGMLPFSHRPTMEEERTAYTPDQAIMVEEFVDRAVPFEDLVAVSNPTQLMGSLFEGAMRHWRSAKDRKTAAVEESSAIGKILRAIARSLEFTQSCKLAVQRYGSTHKSKKMIADFRRLSKEPCTWSYGHGDLHAGNIFVASGTSNVVLVDFSWTAESPSVLDPACLEVDLVFKRASQLPDSLAKSIYKYPIAPLPKVCPTERAEWLWDSVRAIRLLCFDDDADRRAYSLVTAIMLARFASYPDNKPATRRVLAAALASQIVDGLFQ